MSQQYKLAVVGLESSILIYQAIGAETFQVSNAKETQAALEDLFTRDLGDEAKTPEFGGSGIQVEFEVPLILEGFRPGRIVRIRPRGWPNIKPPFEERIKSFEDRWPSPDLFKN